MRFLFTLLAVLLPIFNFAQDQSLSQVIDEKFGDYTGWFVNAIFYSIPFTEEISVPWVLIVLVLGYLWAVVLNI